MILPDPIAITCFAPVNDSLIGLKNGMSLTWEGRLEGNEAKFRMNIVEILDIQFKLVVIAK